MRVTLISRVGRAAYRELPVVLQQQRQLEHAARRVAGQQHVALIAERVDDGLNQLLVTVLARRVGVERVVRISDEQTVAV